MQWSIKNIIMITFKHVWKNQISALNNPCVDKMPLNKFAKLNWWTFLMLLSFFFFLFFFPSKYLVSNEYAYFIIIICLQSYVVSSIPIKYK